MKTICSSKYGNLFFTYILSEGATSNGAIVLLDGLPSNPSSKDQLMQKLSEYNYDVFFPRYEGTWESKGKFLERAPSEPIIGFIEALGKGENIGNNKYKAKKVFLLGASFGGGVALDIAFKYPVDKICVTSPVISFKGVKGIKTLGDYLKTEHSKNYRFDLKEWQKLIQDEVWNLKNNEIKNPSGILIVAGKNDDQIKESDVVKFGGTSHIKVITCDLGHITLSKISDSILLEILNFFSK
ncbi:MAG: hypothetical protein KJ879_02715 [Nanoarchaeota archaeon]|nr:hypothetical protein [Nanoarchaeota archaeon]